MFSRRLVCAQWGPDEQKHRQASRLNHDANEYKGDMHYQEKVKIKQKRYYTSRNNYKSWNAAPVGAVRKNLRTQSDDVI